MIVPMKKVSILVMDKEKESALKRIRELGILHIGRRKVTSPDLTDAIDRRIKLEIAVGVLESFPPLKKNRKMEPPKFEGDLLSHVVKLSERRKLLLGYIYGHQREREHFTKWGDFEPSDFKYLIDNGVNAKLYELTFKSYEEKVGDVPVIILQKDKKIKMVRLIAFGDIPNENSWPIPDRPLHEMEERDRIRQEELAKIESELRSLSYLKKKLKAEQEFILNDIDFEVARATVTPIDENEADESDEILHHSEVKNDKSPNLSVSWLSGYVPEPDMKSLKQAAAENGWAIYADDPDIEDSEVPTKLKNNRFISFIYPLTDFLGIVPGYHETDISTFFLIFFSLFFGMLFGDAGYGLIVTLAAVAGIAATYKKGVPLFCKFLLLMGASTITWGILTCSWFGINVALLPQFFQNISLPLIANVSAEPGWLSVYNDGNFWIQSGLIAGADSLKEARETSTANLMFYCFTIALIHLGLAHLKRMIDKIKSLRAFAELGQLGMIVGMYFVIISLVVTKTGFGGVKTWQIYSIFGGFALVFIFGNYEGSVIKSIKVSLGNIISVVLGITSVFSDVMSYIRLWAVGVAGASLAETINGGVGSMLGDYALIIFGVMLFICGHGFNMTLCVLAVLVHGVRLNTLEFSTNVGLSWAGFKYRPLVSNKKDE